MASLKHGWLIVVSLLALRSLAQIPPGPTDIAKLHQQLEQDEAILKDWPNLGRYRADNAALSATKLSKSRVVFLGDSITDRWGRQYGEFFPGKPYINRGIGGQVTGQMLARFQQDVIALRPRVVVILGGTNDIALGMPARDTEYNLMSMVELAKANGIQVVLASLLPVSNCSRPGQTTRRPLAKLQELNRCIADYCTHDHLVFLDYFRAMSDSQQMLRCDWTVDGVHPNGAGYAAMASLAEKALAKVSFPGE
jgi:lysophospholipase L1-like esterase